MTPDELEGRYETPFTPGPGTKLKLELQGKRAGKSPGQHFNLEASTWVLPDHLRPDADPRQFMRHLGIRSNQGSYRLEGDTLVLEGAQFMHKGGDLAMPGAPPIRSEYKETFRAALLPGQPPGLKLRFFDKDFELFRV